MRIVPFIISTVVTVALIFGLNTRWGRVPDLGNFLSPQTGFWQLADESDGDRSEDFAFRGLKGKVNVYLDERLVPHVFAGQDEDAYFVQGFLHAKYRLWQMDFNARAGAGRLSEVIDDPRLVNYDRLQRRMGMVYAAENMLTEVAKDDFSQKVMDAYTAGVNSYIGTLTQSTLPLEFKLLGYKPERWTNLKSAIFAKLMSADLAGLAYGRDVPFTNEKNFFSPDEMKLLYPEVADSSQPIVPKGTPFLPASVQAMPPATVDSLYYNSPSVPNPVPTPKVTDITGSNNWAVSGSKTATGAPILCNDPHLRLTLPSIWYEMQMHTPTMNAYGATFACLPGVIIGYNEDVAFGMTNAGRDIIDYYRIRFKDESRREYWYDNAWKPSKMRVEKIVKRNGEVVTDSVAYTVFGPVLYDAAFNNGDSTLNASLAMRWVAHDPSNELLVWIKLDRAKTHADYVDALRHINTPAQNFVFASRNGDIAIQQQGKYPLRWKDQGLYVMPGEDSSYAWQGWIPREEAPQVLNPAQGFVQSANQRPVDSTYPYFIPGDYFTPRGVSVFEQLNAMQAVTVDDMKRLQTDTYSPLAADALPFFLQHIDENYLNQDELKYLGELKQWNFRMEAAARAPTIYQAWFDSLKVQVWSDEMKLVNKTVVFPSEQTLFEGMRRDSAFRFVDNRSTPQVETINQQVTTAFKLAAVALAKEEGDNGLIWWKHKGSVILHQLRESLLPFGRTDLRTGGWGNVINAHSKYNGPSWRMIVSLTPEIEAWGIYPAGQSGSPGSRFYDNFVDDWAAGKYYRLWMMKEAEKGDRRIIGTLTFHHG